MYLQSDSFAITDVGAENALSEIGMTFRDLELLRSDATILNIGSGVIKKFEREVLNYFPNISFISVDPTYAITPSMLHNTEWYLQASDDLYLALYYSNRYKSKPEVLEPREAAEVQERRIKLMEMIQGSIALEAPNLEQIPSNSIDFGIDTRGGYHYMSLDDSLIIRYIKETTYLNHLWRVLRSGGSMRVVGNVPFTYKVPREFTGSSIEVIDDYFILRKL